MVIHEFFSKAFYVIALCSVFCKFGRTDFSQIRLCQLFDQAFVHLT